VASDTKERIKAAARELFAQKGAQKTSLQEIADKLGITKPALYYHFASREDLLRSIVQPLIDEGQRLLEEEEKAAPVNVRSLLERFFDFHVAHRQDLLIVLTETGMLAELDLVEIVIAWRARLINLIFGPVPTLAQATRAVMALGGIQDCTVQFLDTPVDELRAATVNAAMSVLDLP
jgi:AcrR family transcriptional regulator